MRVKAIVSTVLLLVAAAIAQNNRILPQGTEIRVRTDSVIPAKPAANTHYTATIADNVMNNSGAVAIPRGSRAQLVAVPSDNGKDTTLDLDSVTVNGQHYLLTTPGSAVGSKEGIGMNKRTGKYVGGGAAVGALLGGLLGGGKGAGIGAIVGGAGGAGAQVYTGRGKELPAETELKYKLAQDLQMKSVAQPANPGLQQRPPSQ